eukprot:TRINITY_DN620_c0_g1_i1.p1 TRINITY_DN620_c0_g1~~TRINITY_DN620_c0_g1_i1.p1  ORF type:complete len:679 (+),score=164.26 TRINITY_DN620_c0_g1_i1:55-2037(+)
MRRAVQGACRLRGVARQQERGISGIRRRAPVGCLNASVSEKSVSHSFTQKRACTAAPRVNQNLRNVSVIAHVDHGKTTLVDALLNQSGQVKKMTGTRVMDSNTIEQERGITILAKNTCIQLPDNTINIVDTPGHADFSGEVERALQMVEGFILLVDGAEGPKPGTRYVLQKSLELNLKPIVVINKVDRTDVSKIESTKDKIESLFLELAINDDQLDYPVLYGSGKAGFMSTEMDIREGTLQPLFDAILETIPPPKEATPEKLQVMVTSMEVDSKGKKDITVRVFSGKLGVKDEVFWTDYIQGEKSLGSFKVQSISKFAGLDKIPATSLEFGDIAVIRSDAADKMDIKIGHSLCAKNLLAPLPYKPLDPPTFMVTLHPNRSPVAGQDGKLFGGPDIRDRLQKEVVRNLAMDLEIKGPDEFQVTGRGLLHLGVLFEEMRRQGFEMELSKPTVLFKTVDGVKHEPWDIVTIRCESDNSDEVSGLMFNNHAEQRAAAELDDGWSETEWVLPGRCMIGLAGQIKSVGGATAEIMQETLDYRPFDSSFTIRREQGSLLSSGEGEVSSDGLNTIAKHGVSFVTDKTKTYVDMIVGRRESAVGDMIVNVTKPSSGWGSGGRTPGYQIHTLETALEYIQDDEFVEITPSTIRMRKRPKSDKDRKNSKKG